MIVEVPRHIVKVIVMPLVSTRVVMPVRRVVPVSTVNIPVTAVIATMIAAIEFARTMPRMGRGDAGAK